VQKIIVQVEVPETIPANDLAQEVAGLLMDTLGAGIVSMKVATTYETITLG